VRLAHGVRRGYSGSSTISRNPNPLPELASQSPAGSAGFVTRVDCDRSAFTGLARAAGAYAGPNGRVGSAGAGVRVGFAGIVRPVDVTAGGTTPAFRPRDAACSICHTIIDRSCRLGRRDFLCLPSDHDHPHMAACRRSRFFQTVRRLSDAEPVAPRTGIGTFWIEAPAARP
jgi:hypothetical protein